MKRFSIKTLPLSNHCAVSARDAAISKDGQSPCAGSNSDRTEAFARDAVLQLTLPKRLDSIMARHASEAVFEELLEAGVTIWRYQSGMLHTKAILIDDDIAFIGTVNIDMRSAGTPAPS